MNLIDRLDEKIKREKEITLEVKNYDFKYIKVIYLGDGYRVVDENGIIGEDEDTLQDVFKRFEIIKIMKSK